MLNPKLGNPAQIISAYQLKFDEGTANGKSVVLVHNGGLEVMFSKSNALDILYLKYNGKNISFLTKNGINGREGGFPTRFDAGFLYTCGMDNIGSCVDGKPMHGSLHLTAAENVNVITDDEKVIVSGVVKDTALFGKNLQLHRKFIVYTNKIEINDTVENCAFVYDGFTLLYHVNYGYPFLDEGLEIKMDLIKSEGRTEFAIQGLKDQFKITPPVDGGDEQCFYNELRSGIIDLINKDLGVKVQMSYDLEQLPFNVMWKSMVSGDYALGIEPCTTLFHNFKMVPIKKGEKKSFNLSVELSEI